MLFTTALLKSETTKYPCYLLGALEGSEGTWPMEQSTPEKTWARVGQVDLFWANIGGK